MIDQPLRQLTRALASVLSIEGIVDIGLSERLALAAAIVLDEATIQEAAR